MPHFFISYSESESALAHRLTDLLRRQGFDVWLNDEHVPAGVTFLKEVEDAIRRAEFLIVIWSTAAAASRWVRLEIDIAQSLERRIIPVIVGGDGDFKMLTEGEAIPLNDRQGLAELKQILTPSPRPSEVIQPPMPEDSLSLLPTRRWKWPIFLFGVVIGLLGFFGAWFGLAK